MKKILTIALFLGLICQVGAYAQDEETTMDAASQSAKIMYAQNDIDEALKILKSKGEDTRTAEDWLLIGNILQDKDRIDEAVYMFQKSIEKDPKFYKAHYNLGYIYLIQEKPNMALAEFKKAVKYKPDFAYGYYNMGCAYLKLKQYGSAKYNFFRAMDLKNDEPAIYYNLAYTYKMMGKEKQAKTYLDLYNKLMERQ
ncbi:MAG: tetratricopeptide repeat protein [Muribaculaceae bacterium]|nr:tetratricopeptide repeat protein [Muribaculaceae bacterium]